MTAQVTTLEPTDRVQRDQLVTLHLGLAHQLARRFANRGEAHDDLVQVASLALVRAAERFDLNGESCSARLRQRPSWAS